MKPQAHMDPRPQWKPLIVCPHAGLSSRIRLALSELGAAGTCHVSEYPRMGALAAMAAQQSANVCFLDVATNTEHAMLLIAEAAPVAPVVALHPRNDADLILRCLRRGASEFLSDPTAEQVAAALEHLGRARTPAEPRANALVVGVVPAKGGSGASTLAAWLAIEMKRAGRPRVLLVDADAVGGSIAFLLKLKPGCHLGDAVRDRGRLDTDLWSHMTLHSHGIDVAPAPENPAAPVEWSRQAAVELLGFWRERYDAVVIDTAGAGAAGVELVQLADQALLVATGQVAALYAARRSFEWLQQNGVDPVRVRLVVNRHSRAAGLERAEVASALKLEVYALLPEDTGAVEEAVLAGRPVAAGSRLGRAIQELAAKLAGKPAAAAKKRSLLAMVGL
jgi:pilus assembly protein CpaE